MTPVLIFDLDGTVLSVNSFPYWVRYMMTGYFGGLDPTERLALSLRTLQILSERKLLGHSHYRTKRRLQILWAKALEKDASQSAMHCLNAVLQKYVRPNMRNLMAAVAERRVDAILATSAAGEYAQGLGRALGFTHILSTPLCAGSDNLENCGERKRDRVMALLALQGWSDRRRFFFTDHEEDLPLIHQCHRIFWFGRDEEIKVLQANSPWAEVVACRNKTEPAIMRLVMPERQASPGKLRAAL